MFCQGDRVIHVRHLNWGHGTVTATPRMGGEYVVDFPGRGLYSLAPTTAEVVLRRVTSPRMILQLRAPRTIASRSASAPRGHEAKAPPCVCCEEALNQSRYAQGGAWKSCPCCSVADGSRHVFLRYPQAFGTTPARANETHPDGPQSYCSACRSGRGSSLPERARRYCGEV